MSDPERSPEPAAPEGAEKLKPWGWVPSLYFTQGLPYLIVNFLSGDMYVLLGIANDVMARSTSLLYLPWVIKPLWSPFVEVFGRGRTWTVATQLVMAAAMFTVVAALQTSSFFALTLAAFWVLAFASATHDIAADGFYMKALGNRQQAWFVGIRSTFYRLAMFFVSGVMLAAAGVLGDRMPASQAWACTFAVGGVMFLVFGIYHWFALPRPAEDEPPEASERADIGSRLIGSITSFFAKPGVSLGLTYLLLYRLAESQLTKMAKPFLFAPRDEGGLALSEESVAAVYGGAGVALLIAGGVLGGIFAANQGLRRSMLPMALAMNVPNLLYIALAFTQPSSTLVIGAAVAVEQLGYGFGFAAYLLYMMKLAEGEHKTAHYSLCTGFMALGMMLPSFVAGDIQRELGYLWFFIWVAIATIPSLIVTVLVRNSLPKDHGAEAA